MNELTSLSQVASFLEEKGYEVIAREDRVDVKTIQGSKSLVAVITKGTKDIDQEHHVMLTFTVPMAKLSQFRDSGQEEEQEDFTAFMYRGLDLNSLSTMDPFSVSILTVDTDAAGDDIVVIRASLVNDVFAFSHKQIHIMIHQMELALAACNDLMDEYFVIDEEEQISA